MKTREYLTAFSFLVLFNSATYCTYTLYYGPASEDMAQFPFIPWLIMALNALLSISELLSEDTFCSLHKLLDYSVVTVTLPCITADFWLNNVGGHVALAYLHAAVGIAPILFYIIQEFRREDLTDLAVISNFISLTIASIVYQNYFAFGAAMLFALAYFGKKREESICLPPRAQDMYNYILVAFNIMSLQSMGSPAE